MTMRERSSLRQQPDQFAHPHGCVGWWVGHLMALTNARRSRWVLSLLALQPTDHILEIGFGSGTDIARLSRILSGGHVDGIDASPLMVRQASKRNANMIRVGRVQLRLASTSSPLPYADATCTKVVSINSFQFWDHPVICHN